MKFNWNQTGMPATLVGRIEQRNELAAIKAVLHDAGSRVMRAVDAEAMAHDLIASGSREIVEMVRDLTTSLAHAEKELADANRRYEQLTADLASRGIKLTDSMPTRRKAKKADDKMSEKPPNACPAPSSDPEWEAWDQKFRSLLD